MKIAASTEFPRNFLMAQNSPPVNEIFGCILYKSQSNDRRRQWASLRTRVSIGQLARRRKFNGVHTTSVMESSLKTRRYFAMEKLGDGNCVIVSLNLLLIESKTYCSKGSRHNIWKIHMLQLNSIELFFGYELRTIWRRAYFFPLFNFPAEMKNKTVHFVHLNFQVLLI